MTNQTKTNGQTAEAIETQALTGRERSLANLTGRKWRKGESGNPAGRPPGRNTQIIIRAVPPKSSVHISARESKVDRLAVPQRSWIGDQSGQRATPRLWSA